MRCHYDILGVATDADDAALKKAYRKSALKWHPDKNMHRQEEATETFKLIQAAYAVLGDPQERQWYDDHRDAILRGGTGVGGEGTDDGVIDLFPFFSAACYTGFADDKTGFYAVYGDLFVNIHESEQYVLEGKSQMAPWFGKSTAPFEDVERFYAHWEGFTTLNTFASRDKWDVREAPDRRVKRLMEKENKKLRDTARKEFTQTVRELVMFIRKRDKRVKAHKQMKQRERDQRMQEAASREIERKRAVAKQAEELENSEEVRLQRELMQESFAALDVEMNKEFGGAESEGGSEDETEPQGMYCVACGKAFKSDKQWQNHQKSKKHLNMVKKLKREMEADQDLMDDIIGSTMDGEVQDGDGLIELSMDDLTPEELAGLTPEELALLMDDDALYVSDGSDDLDGGMVGGDTGIPLPNEYGDTEDDGSFPLPAGYTHGDKLPGSGDDDGDGAQSWDARGMFDAPLSGNAPLEDLGSDESDDSDTERFNTARAKATPGADGGSDGDSDGVDNDEDFFLRAAQQSKKSKKKTSKGGKKKKKVGGGYQVNQGDSSLMADAAALPPTDKGKGKGKGKGKAKPTFFDPDDDGDSDVAAADDAAVATAPTASAADGSAEDGHAADASAATPSLDSPGLPGVPLAFLPFIAGKTVVGGSVKMFPGASNAFPLPKQLIEAFFASGRRVARPDTLPDPKAGDAASDGDEAAEDDGAGPTVFVDEVRFSDGSSYVDSGGKPRYKPNPDEEADPAELEAAGLEERSGYFWWTGPPPPPLSLIPEHDGGSDDGVVLSKKDKRKAKKKAKETRTAEALVTQAAAEAGGDELGCQICGKLFDSRNKLFQHIKQTGHAMLLAEANNRDSAKEKRKKKAAGTRSKNTSFRSF